MFFLRYRCTIFLDLDKDYERVNGKYFYYQYLNMAFQSGNVSLPKCINSPLKYCAPFLSGLTSIK